MCGFLIEAFLATCRRAASASFVTFATLLSCAALLPLLAAGADTPPPVKLAIFDFELEDFSAGGSPAGESPADTDLLKQITADARRLISEAGRYSLVDTGGADAEAV